MVTSTPLTTSPNGARAEDGRDQESPLDRTRGKADRARQALTEAGQRADDVDERLERVGAQVSADEKALAAALAEVNRLKKALKDGEKERRKLVLARKRAIADVEKAEEKARKAEAKYNREVLADIIEREKEHDRAASSGASIAVPAVLNSEPVRNTDVTRMPADEVELPADGPAGAPATEPEDLAIATARATAARATAASAGESAQPAPTPPTPRRSTRSRTSRPGSPASPDAEPAPSDAPSESPSESSGS
jgi:hypothetical protein